MRFEHNGRVPHTADRGRGLTGLGPHAKQCKEISVNIVSCYSIGIIRSKIIFEHKLSEIFSISKCLTSIQSVNDLTNFLLISRPY